MAILPRKMTSYRKVLRLRVLRLHFCFTKMALVPREIRLKRGEVSSRKAGGCWGQDDEGGEHGKAEDVKVAQACPTLGIFPTQGSNPGLPHCRRILYQLSHQGSCGLNVIWEKKPLERHERKKGNQNHSTQI